VDVRAYNRTAWDSEVWRQNPWTIPVDPPTVERARQGDWDLFVTPTRPVPRAWFPDLKGLKTLCLAGGGGQQAPLLAAAGGQVTVVDNSPWQLEQDRRVASRDGLEIALVESDMADLSMFDSETFGLIVHPTSNLYVPDVRTVWREAFRVLRPQGVLISGFDSPVRHIFDSALADRGELRVRHRLPYSDVTSLTKQELAGRLYARQPLAFGHLLEDQIGGQIDAGFLISGFFEDRFPDHFRDPLSYYIPTFAVTRAIKVC
jgi:SAM-dependent methyltransferase